MRRRTIDGTIAEVNSDDLTTQTNGPLVWPSAPPGGRIGFPDVANYATAEDQPELDRSTAAKKKYEACRQSLYGKAQQLTLGKENDRIEHQIKGDSMDATMSTLGNMSEEKCHPNLREQQKIEHEVAQKLVASRTARRAERLKQAIAKVSR